MGIQTSLQRRALWNSSAGSGWALVPEVSIDLNQIKTWIIDFISLHSSASRRKKRSCNCSASTAHLQWDEAQVPGEWHSLRSFHSEVYPSSMLWQEFYDAYLVGGWTLPLWKIRLRQLGWWHSQLNGKIKNAPNHQPVYYTYDLFGIALSKILMNTMVEHHVSIRAAMSRKSSSSENTHIQGMVSWITSPGFYDRIPEEKSSYLDLFFSWPKLDGLSDIHSPFVQSKNNSCLTCEEDFATLRIIILH